MWKIYDELIATIPDDAVAPDYLAGRGWLLVRSLADGKVNKLFPHIQSWNFFAPALAMADSDGGSLRHDEASGEIFARQREDLHGKRVSINVRPLKLMRSAGGAA